MNLKKQARTVVASLIAVGAGVTLTPAAHATAYGLAWAKSTVYVYVDRNVSGRWYVDRALGGWSGKGQGPRLVRTSSPSRASIFVHQRSIPGLNPVAKTQYRTSGWDITRIDITLDPDFVYRGSFDDRRYAASHEVGHALGLAHNHSSKSSLMYDRWPTYRKFYPNSYDVRDLESLYRG